MSQKWHKWGRAIAETLGEGPPTEQVDAQLARLVADAEALPAASPRATRTRLRWPVLGAAATACLALLIWRVLPNADPPLTCQTSQGTPAHEGDWLQASGAKPLMLVFSEGTVVNLQEHGRLRVTHMRSREVDLLLESGKLHATVRPAQTRRWRYRAGPYRVTVVGTQLAISWRPRAQQLAVEVATGAVRVEGGNIPGPGIVVDAQQRLEANAQHGEARLMPRREQREDRAGTPSSARDGEADAGLPDAVVPAANALDAAQGAAGRQLRPALRPHPSDRINTRWRALARAGEYRLALVEAERVGLRALARRLGAKDLVLLADVVRTRGEAKRARQLLLTIRRRFPQTEASHHAAFRLGRLARDRLHDDQQVIHWYRTFLREAPGSRLAADALGRLMSALHRSGKRDQARRAAIKYLGRYPGEGYSDLARLILQQ